MPTITRSDVLHFLSGYDQRAEGYEYRGRRGWALPEEVASVLGRSAKEMLVQLAGRRALDRENVAPPQAQTPIWIYRINGKGAAEVGLPPPAELEAPEENPPVRTIFRDSQWLVLEILREAKQEQSPKRFLPPEIGWRTAAEIAKTPHARAADVLYNTFIQTGDYRRLILLGMVEQRQPEGLDRDRTRGFYRITELGEKVERLQRAKSGQQDG